MAATRQRRVRSRFRGRWGRLAASRSAGARAGGPARAAARLVGRARTAGALRRLRHLRRALSGGDRSRCGRRRHDRRGDRRQPARQQSGFHSRDRHGASLRCVGADDLGLPRSPRRFRYRLILANLPTATRRDSSARASSHATPANPGPARRRRGRALATIRRRSRAPRRRSGPPAPPMSAGRTGRPRFAPAVLARPGRTA